MITGVILTLISFGVCWFVLYPYYKVKRLRRHVVLQVDGADTRYPDLPLGNLGILWQVKQLQRVQVIFPKLTSDGDVEYVYSWHDLKAVHLPRLTKPDAYDKARLKAAQEMASLITEHLQLETELLNLRKQHQKISELLKLVTTSDFYANQQDVYERALAQVENLMDQAEALRQVYIRFIREVLIGNQLAGYDPSLLPDNQGAIDLQYRKMKQEYQMMKDVATAYTGLLQSRQIQ